jgi:hypothetical protein
MIKPIPIPDNFIPLNYNGLQFKFRKLQATDAEVDFEKVMTSIDIIHKTRGGAWPQNDLNLEENRIDLSWHQREFENNSSFAYVIESESTGDYIGCFYIYPMGFRAHILSENQNYDGDISFWITQNAFDEGLYKFIYLEILDFVATKYSFLKLYWSNILIPS